MSLQETKQLRIMSPQKIPQTKRIVAPVPPAISGQLKKVLYKKLVALLLIHKPLILIPLETGSSKSFHLKMNFLNTLSKLDMVGMTQFLPSASHSKSARTRRKTSTNLRCFIVISGLPCTPSWCVRIKAQIL